MALSIQAAGDPAKGKALYATCASCHGANGEGNQALNAPAIAGQQEWYLTRQLKNYQDGIRGTHAKDVYGMQMRPMSMVVWGEKKTADVVAYITSLPDPENAAITLGGDPAVGQANYMVCASCHGMNGEGNQALNSPRIAGQFDWYTHRQLDELEKWSPWHSSERHVRCSDDWHGHDPTMKRCQKCCRLHCELG